MGWDNFWSDPLGTLRDEVLEPSVNVVTAPSRFIAEKLTEAWGSVTGLAEELYDFAANVFSLEWAQQELQRVIDTVVSHYVNFAKDVAKHIVAVPTRLIELITTQAVNTVSTVLNTVTSWIRPRGIAAPAQHPISSTVAAVVQAPSRLIESLIQTLKSLKWW